MANRSKAKPRSGCPVSLALERFGDRWSLLVIRDLMVRGYRTFKEFQEAGEGIASNVLADRLRNLEAAGIVSAERAGDDARRVHYRLTEKGIDLAPVLLELLIWGAKHGGAGPSCAAILKMEKKREQILAETRRRWKQRDSTPLIPGPRRERSGKVSAIANGFRPGDAKARSRQGHEAHEGRLDRSASRTVNRARRGD